MWVINSLCLFRSLLSAPFGTSCTRVNGLTRVNQRKRSYGRLAAGWSQTLLKPAWGRRYQWVSLPFSPALPQKVLQIRPVCNEDTAGVSQSGPRGPQSQPSFLTNSFTRITTCQACPVTRVKGLDYNPPWAGGGFNDKWIKFNLKKIYALQYRYCFIQFLYSYRSNIV